MTTQTKPDKKLIEEMLKAACHFGHRVSKWNPKMRPYLYTQREGIHIFNLEKTYEHLMNALNFLKDCAMKGKIILLVSTKLQAAKLIAEAAKKCECPYVTRKWMPGLLTNFDTIRRRIRFFKDLKEQKAVGDWEKYKKKERLDLQRTLDKLEDAFSGVEQMAKLPDAIFVLDCIHDALALREARRLKIPAVGICDSNADPDLLAYPIPGNDDAIKSLKFFVAEITEAIETGKKLQVKASSPPVPVKKPQDPKKISKLETPVV